ncbi:MAG TPA: type II secretion system protein [Nitrospiria bacterium]|nr:type II secretion system protein [Nitrospiria bacterium]
MDHRWKKASNRGLTLIELLVTMTILFILASVALPLSRMSDRRGREIELRQDLREMREAIDRFKRDWDLGRISHLESDVANAESGYPASLGILVKGAPAGDVKGGIRKYLRRIPEDPITRSKEWGRRCYSDEPDSLSWCGDDVYDVYSESDEKGLDGTPYEEW